jgi:hypothetical protein
MKEGKCAKFASISIPSKTYEKLVAYSKKFDLSVRSCSKILIEEGIKDNSYAKRFTQTKE